MNKRTALAVAGILTIAATVGIAVRTAWRPTRAVTPAALPLPASMPAQLAAWLTEFERAPLDSTVARQINAAVRRIRIAPLSSDAWVRLGDALTARSRAKFDTSLYEKIERIYLRAHQLDGANADSLAGLAWAAGAAHRFDDSIAWATLALKVNPEIPAAHAILGDAAVELGRYEEAGDHYQKMLDLHPDAGAYSRAAHLLYLEGNVPRAMGLIGKAIAAAGNDPEQAAWSVAELAMMQCREGAAPVAVHLLEPWLKQAPENPTLLAAFGLALMAANEDAAAITALEHAVALAPQHSSLAALHDLYRAAGRDADADHAADRIEALHRQLQKEQIQGGEGQLARFYADRGVKGDEAVRLAEKEHAHHRGAVAADTLAWAYFKAGRTAEAQKLIPEILRHRVSDPAMLYHVGLIEADLGKGTEARRHLYGSLNREPRFNPVHAPLARAELLRLSSGSDLALGSPKP